MLDRAFLKTITVLALLVLVLAACAPENLDITPTPEPTAVPIIKVDVSGAVNQPNTIIELPLGSRVEDAINAAGGALETADLSQVNLAQTLSDGAKVIVPVQGETLAPVTPEPTAAAVIDLNRALLDHLLATMPEVLTAGITQWRVDKSIEVKIVEREGGLTARISFGESGGGQMELTYGVFSTPEAAKAWYDKQYESLAGQSQLEEKSQFSTPNAFSKGTNTSAAIFVRDNIFIRYYVPTFSSTTGEPLTQLAPPVFEILDASLASYTPPS